MALTSFLGRAGVLAALFLPAVFAHSEEDLDHMGPLGAMWPPDREWSEEEGRTAPCGSPAGVTNRTEFPLNGASLALEQKDIVYDLQVYISLSENPTSNDDFTLISSAAISSLDFSHVCIDSPSLPPTAAANQNATLQFRYMAEYIDPNHEHKRHLPVNETFYACSDIALVQPEVFTFEIPCFNVTGSPHDSDGGEDHHHDDEREDGRGRLSRGDIAGIVIGCVVGVAMIGSLGWYLWRRDRREKAVAQHIVETGEK